MDKPRHSLPPEIQKAEFKAPEAEEITKISSEVAPSKAAERLISPHPIIVSNSGIEGIFDIQRIIVTMIDREKLLQKVAKAVAPTQKISGWCTISTGFAYVAVNFTCEQRISRAQLEVVKAVEDRVIREEDRADKLQQDLEKPDLQLVAGEWVLARFSGAPGAKWFLCYLEPGSTHQFYSHRIAPRTLIRYSPRKGQEKARQAAEFASQGFELAKGIGVKYPQTAKPLPIPVDNDDGVEDF
ncbi:hypothetical protein DL768_004236 [Monosporascus sp. mg162]|nr:hypothetical protein DL768_004236 [Monosporascus sp. mg162]